LLAKCPIAEQVPGLENRFFKKLEKTPGGTVNDTMLVSPYELIPTDHKYW
jgi:hypothetical protein